MVTVCLGIPTTADWVPERAKSLERLLGELGVEQNESVAPDGVPVKILRARAPHWVWSEQLWTWGVQTGADWVLQLQDDVRVAPNVWPALRAMLEAVPADCEVICLEVAHQAAKALADEGVRWITTADALIGVGYLVRRETLKAFLEWRRTQLHDGALAEGGLTEDTMLGIFCMVTGRRVWGPLPTLIDHDTSIASTYGNDEHTNRRPLVRWDTGNWAAGFELDDADSLESPSFWSAKPKHLGRFYEATPGLAARWVKGVTVEDLARWKADDGAPVLTGLRYRMLANAYREPTFKLFVATPYQKAGVQPEHMASVLGLQKLIGVDVQHEMELGLRHENQDLVRVRSRMLRIAYEAGFTHILFTDGDSAWSPSVVAAMLRTGKDVVQCPYLRTDGRGYSIRPTEKDRLAGRTATEDIQSDNTIEIEHTGLGLTLISRECMKRMLEHYAGLDRERVDLEKLNKRLASGDMSKGQALEQLRSMGIELERWRSGAMGLTSLDLVDGQIVSTVNLFQLLNRDGVLCSEDASFATRWRAIGGRIWLYIGDGSPIAHYGRNCFQGSIEDLGFTRAKKVA